MQETIFGVKKYIYLMFPLTFCLAHVLYANMEGEGFMTDIAASHQGT